MSATRTQDPPAGGSPARPGAVDVVLEGRQGTWEATVARTAGPADLSDLVPPLEALGFHVVAATEADLDGRRAQRLALRIDRPIDDEHVAAVRGAMQAVLDGTVPADPLLAVIPATGMLWEQVEVIAAQRQMLVHLGTWGRDQVTDALVAIPEAAGALWSMFSGLLSPEGSAIEVTQADHIVEVLRQETSSLDHDRTLEDLAACIRAIQRTNHWSDLRHVRLPDGRLVRTLASKYRSADLPRVPAPVPHAEILVTSAVATGVHLRGGPIARGGLRWSDRGDDVRTEVLDLVTAQIVKNSVIVPTGAKGGFVLQDVPTDPTAIPAAVTSGYRVFVTGLLSLTDDVVDGEVVPPDDVVRRDGDDPYLVVAADKGTALLSDTANDLAAEHDFWLGDAFASGGSAGYDHKALGITAAGAWRAIARHFRELGVDVHTDPVTLVGIGDMSGDVFGNGLLTSRTLRLVAAFDHRDIFLDPDPDPIASHEERLRLFEQPGSSWQDWDRAKLSDGGGVFSRSAKQVPLSREVRALLDVQADSLTPNALVRAILRARVDLLYAGGIGTVIQASDEVGVADRATAGIRVTADEVRARVIGEGANLAITQRGRIEFARRGGRIDQDAVHNAGGVAISDREVNCKLLLAPEVRAGRISAAERDELLTRATDEVVTAVLQDVDAQVWMLSRIHDDAAAAFPAHRRQVGRLVAAGRLDLDVDVLPDDEEAAARAAAGAGLTRPELATVVAATRRELTDVALSAGLADHAIVRAALRDYFPATLVEAVGDEALERHRLADRIAVQQLVNGIVDRHGPTLVHELASEHDVPVADVLAALAVAAHVADAGAWFPRMLDLAREVLPDALDEVAAELTGLEATIAMTLVRDGIGEGVDALAGRLRDVATAIHSVAGERAGSGPMARQRLRLLDDLVPDDLAVVAATRSLRTDLADVAWLLAPRADGPRAAADTPDVDVVARALDALGLVDDRLLVGDLRRQVHQLLRVDWDARLRVVLDRDLRDVRRRAALAVLEGTLDLGVAVGPDLRDLVRVAVADARQAAPAPLTVAIAALRTRVDDLA